MYCVKCGVELADSERKCPLCSTPVYFPELPAEPERPYPKFVKMREEISPKGIYFVLSILFVIAAGISLICDLSVNASVVWSGYVIGALALGYVIFILPRWWRRPSPAIFAPIDFAAIALYLLYIDLETGGGWFLGFALPTVGAVALIVCGVTILIYYLRCGYLYIFGGAFCAFGAFCPLLELMIHLNFAVHDKLVWALYPLVALLLIGIMLIVIAIVKPFKESLRKIFAI